MYLNKKAIEFMQLEDTGITSDSFIEAIKLGGSEAAGHAQRSQGEGDRKAQQQHPNQGGEHQRWKQLCAHCSGFS